MRNKYMKSLGRYYFILRKIFTIAPNICIVWYIRDHNDSIPSVQGIDIQKIYEKKSPWYEIINVSHKRNTQENMQSQILKIVRLIKSNIFNLVHINK